MLNVKALHKGTPRAKATKVPNLLAPKGLPFGAPLEFVLIPVHSIGSASDVAAGEPIEVTSFDLIQSQVISDRRVYSFIS